MNLATLVMQAYPSPEWAVFFEVGNGTGFRTRRHADAVAIGIREKADPAKAEEPARRMLPLRRPA